MPVPGGEDDIEITAILRDEFSRPADRVVEQIDRMENATEELSEATDDLTEAQERNTRATDENADTLRDNTRERDSNTRATRQDTTETDRDTTSTRRNSREREKSTKSLGDLVKGFGKFGKILQLFKFAIMLDGIAKALAGVAAVGAIAGVAVFQAGSIIAGALLPLPALLGGAALGVATLKLGFQGIGEAISAYDPNDLTAFNEAIKDMGPNGQAAALALAEVKDAFKPIQKLVQESLLDGFADDIYALGDMYLPLLSDALDITAGRLNDTIKIGMGFLQLPSTIDSVASILDNASLMAEQMGHAFNGALRGTIAMFDAVDEVAVTMMNDIAKGVNSLADMVANNGDAIGAFAERGYAGVRYFLGVVVDLGAAFVNILSLGGNLFDGMGGSFQQLAEKFRAWTNSVEGQQKIKDFFAQLRPILEALVGLGKDVAIAIGSIAKDNMGTIAPLIEKFREMVPSIKGIVDSAAGAAPAFADIAAAILSIVGETEAMGPTAAILQTAVGPMESLANVISSLPGPIQTAIGWMVTFGLVAKAAAGTALGGMAINALKATKAYQFLTLAIKTNIQAMGWYIRTQLASMFTTMAAGIRTAAIASWEFTASLLANPITWIVIAVVALIAAFVLLWMKCEAFRNVIKAIGQWFVDVWNNQIYPLVDKTWQWMQQAWDKVLAVVMTVVGAVVAFFVGAWNTIKPVVMTVIEIFTTVFNIVKTIVMTYIGIVVTIFRTYFNIVKTIVMGVINFFGPLFMGVVGIVGNVIGLVVDIFQLGWNIIRLVVNVAILIIGAVVMKIWSIAQTVMTFVVTVFQAGWAIVQSVIQTAVNIIGAIVQTIVTVVATVVGFIAPYFQAAWTVITTIVGVAVGFIGGVINTISGVVSAVMGVVSGIFSSVWNSFTGIVSGVVGAIGTVISTLSSVVSGPLNAIKTTFFSVFGAIRDFVMGIINRISGAIDAIRSVVSGISSGIGALADAIPGLATGGPVTGGMKAMVGEVGPEAFVTNSGKVSAIGAKGPEIRKFSEPGYVVPNHVLKGKKDSSVPNAVMGKLTAATARPEGTTTTATRPQRGTGSEESYMQGSGDGVVVHVDMRGATIRSEIDMERAIKKAMREVQRNDAERN